MMNLASSLHKTTKVKLVFVTFVKQELKIKSKDLLSYIVGTHCISMLFGIIILNTILIVDGLCVLGGGGTDQQHSLKARELLVYYRKV